MRVSRPHFFTVHYYFLLSKNPDRSQRKVKSEEVKSKIPPAKMRTGFLEVPPRFELGNRGFADLCLTTWLWHRILNYIHKIRFYEKNGADDEARTRYLHLGKVALYQMSYIRTCWCLRPESNQRHVDFQSTALPTELQRHRK